MIEKPNLYYQVVELMKKYINEKTEYNESDYRFFSNDNPILKEFNFISISSNSFDSQEVYDEFLENVLTSFSDYIKFIGYELIMNDKIYTVEFEEEQIIKKLLRKEKLTKLL